MAEMADKPALSECMQHTLFVSGNVHWKKVPSKSQRHRRVRQRTHKAIRAQLHAGAGFLNGEGVNRPR